MQKEKIGKDKYIIFLDIDNTVFDGKRVPEKTAKALAKAKELGHKVFINTGRAHCIVTKDIIDAIRPDGIVSAMGTSIFVGDECIFSALMKEEDAKFLVKYGDDIGAFVIIESVEKLVIMHGQGFMGQDNFIEKAEDLYTSFPDMKVSKISIMRTLPDDDLAMLRARFPAVYSHSGYTEIPPEGCNKATAIARVCEYYGTDVAHSIAMGDSGNDYDMIKLAGIGVAMGNATDDIKEVADFVTTRCEEGGVAYALEKLLFEKE
ncbi:MAG: HAD family phosphatase [Clostridia bacterium]|nr:HAD family phosphatase [Clostridia bacterium]